MQRFAADGGWRVVYCEDALFFLLFHFVIFVVVVRALHYFVASVTSVPQSPNVNTESAGEHASDGAPLGNVELCEDGQKQCDEKEEEGCPFCRKANRRD